MIPISDFKKEVLDWAEEIQVNPKEIQVRSLSRKWASCSSKGRLTFSYALLDESNETRSKAIVHELLHLKYANHGKIFRTTYVTYLRKKGITVKFNEGKSIE